MNIPNPTRRVRIEIEPEGRAAKHGRDVFKFRKGRCMSRILARRGWTLVHEAKQYVHLQRPSQAGANPLFEIDIAIPTRDEVLSLAEQCREAEHEWIEEVGEWVGIYIPARTYTTQSVDRFTGAKGEQKHGGTIEPHFEVGEPGVWSAYVMWKKGDPVYGENVENVLKPNQPGLFSDA